MFTAAQQLSQSASPGKLCVGLVNKTLFRSHMICKLPASLQCTHHLVFKGML